MARNSLLLDQYGRPVDRNILKQEVAAPTFGGVRSPISGYPADGLNPVLLAQILREADSGHPVRYLELAETIEERDPHYVGVLATRRRSVSQIDITVEAASDDKRDVEIADMIRAWLKRDELTDELFDILDCIGKGYSFTEIIWETSEGQWRPERLEYRDPRWFRFNRIDLKTPMMLGEHGQERPLDAFKFIYSQIKAKSGLPIRSGIARIAVWGWMFKAFTQRDWAIFTQTYGQPLRIGKYGPGASAEDRDTLFAAVANIAGDCAAIISDSMTIDFVETKSVGKASDLYERRIDHLDRQISKAILGQTATTDALTGGLGSGKEHREVQEVIERADCKALAAILNRDLVRPWVDLEFGPQKTYPRLIIGRPEPEDLELLAKSLGTLVPLGLKVSSGEIRDKFGLAEPGPNDEILGVSEPIQPNPPGSLPNENQKPSIEREPAKIKRGAAPSGIIAPQAEGSPSGALKAARTPADLITQNLLNETTPQIDTILDTILEMVDAAQSLEELSDIVSGGFADLDADKLASILALAISVANLSGRADLVDQSA